MQVIEVIVRPDGSSQVETRGFTGNSCRQASEFLQHALGLPQHERLKPECFQAEVAPQQQQQQARQP